MSLYLVEIECKSCKSKFFGRISVNVETVPKPGDSVQGDTCPTCKKLVTIRKVV